ncbi:MAG: alpha/beta hydrolase [Gemmatimonadetes bacterium]|uniref:Alpha/beta hydrolase n=1 Tax=Candidatus Kutchimonas denitrificans TaxID=3056748 RepID=A0AAE4ZAL1_9BACT|nr:alpha/beta hydrolase [Gemmatimonadota bacterium]NIR76399.1 alpha/beta hydrolase [Candidatus Kutchimonas denitrificans]NIS03209.1 alpha/beta hydrolase [Gemmatimonadota bacterium]NIT66382.1 alpha/beta hydrolase [Gemmatimonadota bacterium]NIU54461.1 alpha/beta hydrolase [Gemmatimonadota bacterium]
MTDNGLERIDFPVEGSSVRVSGLVLKPTGFRFVYVLAHGAGAGMEHRFMEQVARRLAGRGVATVRFQFPYMEQGRRRPDPRHLLLATVRAAVRHVGDMFEGAPLFAGGKSMGGRMTSNAAAEESLAGVRGLIFLGFPLHAPGKVGVERAAHLDGVGVPMLFVQGTRDNFARLDLLEPICQRLGATLHIIEGADHSFGVLKRSGRDVDEVMDELAGTVAAWGEGVLG